MSKEFQAKAQLILSYINLIIEKFTYYLSRYSNNAEYKFGILHTRMKKKTNADVVSTCNMKL